MVKILFLTALVVTSIGVVSPCAPPTLQQQYMSGTVPQTNIPAGVPEHYIRQYQQLHRDNPCVQCDAIVAQSSCSNHWHNSQFSCPTPRIAYGLNGQCGQATITCAPDQSTGHPMMVVALLDNSDGRFGQNAQVYAPISSLGNGPRSLATRLHNGKHVVSSIDGQLPFGSTVDRPMCSSSRWICHATKCRALSLISTVDSTCSSIDLSCSATTSLRCASTNHSRSSTAQYVETSQNADGVVVDEDVRVEIIGTTLIPIVKERVVQNVIKEIHNYPIQKKRIIKTKHISKPTEEHREYIERVPATRIVPTFEERRATQVIRGTTLVPMVEEIEVTEMLPEVTEAPAVVHRPTYRRVVRPVAVVKNSAYETVPEQTSSIQETRAEQGYGKNQPQQTSYGENSAPNGYEQSQPSSAGYQFDNNMRPQQTYTVRHANSIDVFCPFNFSIDFVFNDVKVRFYIYNSFVVCKCSVCLFTAVKKLSSRSSRKANDSNAYSPISSISSNSMLLTLICNSESQWIMKSRDDNDLAQPLTVQCAFNAPNFKLPTLMDLEVFEEKPKANETPKKSKKKKDKKSKKLVTEESVNQTTTIQPEQKE
ncbi:hypothetical protein M3Y96_00001900 [Aphelenchoides besseyi]|nr:hypothetical protein M3Y96_00001900 [Aphelenchoides besseyi]